MRAAFLFLLLASPVASWSQDPYYSGVLVDTNGKVWVGRFQIFSEMDVVVLDHPEGREVFPPWRGNEIRYYDSTANVNRKLISFASGKEIPRYYEVVVEGPVRVVRHCTGNRAEHRDVDYDYYYVERFLEEASLIPLPRFRDRLFKKVRLMTLDKTLDPNDLADAIRYIQRYNQALLGAPLPDRN